MELFRKHGEPLDAGVRALAVAADAKTASPRRKKHALEVVRSARAEIAGYLDMPKPSGVDANWSSARVVRVASQLAQAEAELVKETR